MTTLVVDERTELRTPYRGIAPFRLVDAPIFFAREREVRDLFRHVAVYRGVLLYGDSGVGKSSLINAGFIPLARSEGFLPERIRIQKRRGQEIVVERISTRADGGPPYLPSFLADGDPTASHTVLSVEDFERKLSELHPGRDTMGGAAMPTVLNGAGYEAVRNTHPVLIFDQFEEFVTLFDAACGGDGEEMIDTVRSRIATTLINLIHDHRIPVKFLFVFREDYLAKLGLFFRETPDLPGHNLRLAPPAREELDPIIRGPFERFPGHFAAELSPALAECMIAEIVARNGAQAVNLSELQIACLRLWQSSDPVSLFKTRGLVGLLEDYLSDAFSQFRKELRDPCLVLLTDDHAIWDTQRDRQARSRG